jgi:hypothetical protein
MTLPLAYKKVRKFQNRNLFKRALICVHPRPSVVSICIVPAK